MSNTPDTSSHPKYGYPTSLRTPPVSMPYPERSTRERLTGTDDGAPERCASDCRAYISVAHRWPRTVCKRSVCPSSNACQETPESMVSKSRLRKLRCFQSLCGNLCGVFAAHCTATYCTLKIVLSGALTKVRGFGHGSHPGVVRHSLYFHWVKKHLEDIKCWRAQRSHQRL